MNRRLASGATSLGCAARDDGSEDWLEFGDYTYRKCN